MPKMPSKADPAAKAAKKADKDRKKAEKKRAKELKKAAKKNGKGGAGASKKKKVPTNPLTKLKNKKGKKDKVASAPKPKSNPNAAGPAGDKPKPKIDLLGRAAQRRNVELEAKINDMERQMQGMNMHVRSQSHKMEQARRLLTQ